MDLELQGYAQLLFCISLYTVVCATPYSQASFFAEALYWKRASSRSASMDDNPFDRA